MKKTALIAAALCIMLAPAARAQDAAAPPLPAPLQNLVAEGAQMRYLGSEGGLSGWIAIQNGQEQYFYVTPNGEAFVMGLLFDKNGKMMTMRQVAELQEKSGGGLDVFAEPGGAQAQTPALAGGDKNDFKTPSEQLFSDVESGNWIPLGNDGAPVIYSFVDPQCPYCHALITDMRKDYIDTGAVQVRMIPVGFKEGSMEQSAFLLAVPNPQARWYRHLEGDAEALPVTPGINEQGVQRNMAIMQSWKFDVTPLTVYRAKSGQVKIVQGRVKDLAALVSDLAPATKPAPQATDVQ